MLQLLISIVYTLLNIWNFIPKGIILKYQAEVLDLQMDM